MVSPDCGPCRPGERTESISGPCYKISKALSSRSAALTLLATQAAGRERVFRDCRLRVAAVMRGYGVGDREQGPSGSRAAQDG